MFKFLKQWFLIVLLLMIGCRSDGVEIEEHDHEQALKLLVLPDLTAVSLNKSPLHIVVTTSIIGDVVQQVGGDRVMVTTLIMPGQDSHSFEPTPADLTAVSQADLILVNGWDLEEALVHDLEAMEIAAPIVPLSANIVPLPLAADADHAGADPHVWFRIDNVAQWTNNAVQLLSQLDPTNQAIYEANGAAYLAQLNALEADVVQQLDQISAERRLLVTNHNVFGYFAEAYEFTVIGTVIPAASTAAEPSAAQLAELIALMETYQLCTIFTETSVNDGLAQTVAGELTYCDAVSVLPLYTESLGVLGSDADTYIGMYRANIAALVEGLSNE